MKVLVCVKRVPMTGGRIVLTDDAQQIETRHLGFTISPHEECGVEEAVRLVEQHGGESVVLTLGPADAAEQLRDAMAIGHRPRVAPRDRRRGVGSRGDGRRDPGRDPRRRGGLGGLRPDLLRQRVGRLGRVSGRPPRSPTRSAAPVRPASRVCVVEGTTVRCEQELAGGRDVYELPLPAVVTVLEGLNFPRYPSVPGRMRAGRKPLDASSPTRPPSRLERTRLVVPEGESKQAEILGHGADGGAGRRGAPAPDRGRVVNPRRDRARGRRARPTSRCRRSPSPAPRRGRRTRCSSVPAPRGARRRSQPTSPTWPSTTRSRHSRRMPGRRSSARWRSESARQPSSHPAPSTPPTPWHVRRPAWASRWRRIAPRSAPGDPISLTRIRWGGSLLEEARLHAGRALLTVAPHAVAAAEPGEPWGDRGVHARARRGRPRRPRSRPHRAAGGRHLARGRKGRRHGRTRRRLGRRLRARSRSLPRCWKARSAARAR